MFALFWCTLIVFTESLHSLDPPRMKSMRLDGVGATNPLQILGILNRRLDGFLGAGGGVTTDRMDPSQMLSSRKIKLIIFLGAGGGKLGFYSLGALPFSPEIFFCSHVRLR